MGMSHSRTAPMSFKKTSRTTWGHDKRFGGNLCLLPSHCFLSCEPLWGLAEGTDLRKDYSLTSLLLPFQSCDVQRGGGGILLPKRQAISGDVFGCPNWGRKHCWHLASRGT